jgi:hypothetical protein
VVSLPFLTISSAADLQLENTRRLINKVQWIERLRKNILKGPLMHSSKKVKK